MHTIAQQSDRRRLLQQRLDFFIPEPRFLFRSRPKKRERLVFWSESWGKERIEIGLSNTHTLHYGKQADS